MLDMVFDVIPSLPCFFVSCNTKATSVLICTFYKNLIVLNRVDNTFSSLFWHLYQIDTFNNNLNNEEMIASHMMCELKKNSEKKEFEKITEKP